MTIWGKIISVNPIKIQTEKAECMATDHNVVPYECELTIGDNYDKRSIERRVHCYNEAYEKEFKIGDDVVVCGVWPKGENREIPIECVEKYVKRMK